MTTYSSGETTKQKLINATGKLAAELGFDNVSTRAVADASGENIGSIHYHFGGKEGLFEEVVGDAIGCCQVKLDEQFIDELGDSPSREMLAEAIRFVVVREINDMFRSDRPVWHSQVIYQLMQRDDTFYEMFRREVLEPGMQSMYRFFKLIDPEMGDEDAFLHTVTMKMPIFAHANYRKAMLDRLKVKDYSEEYLQKLENLLVRQTQLSLGLPEA